MTTTNPQEVTPTDEAVEAVKEIVTGYDVYLAGEDAEHLLVKALATFLQQRDAGREGRVWQPIETAPRDGTPILLLRLPARPWTRVELASRKPNDTGWWIVDSDPDEWRTDQVDDEDNIISVAPDDLNDTSRWLWQPLPPPPTEPGRPREAPPTPTENGGQEG